LLQRPKVPLHPIDADGQAIFEGEVLRMLRQDGRGTRLGRCFRRLGFTYNNKDVGRKMVIGASKYSVKTAL